MAATHKVLITSGIAATNVDSMVLCGKATTDMDNGTLVTLGAMGLTANGGFEYTVAAAAAASTGCYIVATPEVGATLDMQVYSDPRNFYNVAGKPMSIKRLAVGDHIEVVGLAGLTVGEYANALYAAASSAPASGTYFTVVAAHTTAIGQDVVPTFILRCERN